MRITLAIFGLIAWSGCSFLFSDDSGDGTTNDAGVADADDDPEFLDGWEIRRALTVPAASAVLTDFPLLVRVVADAELASSVLRNGDDIRFTMSDGVTLLAHELQSIDPDLGSIAAWVRLPTYATEETRLFLYYGNPEATAGTSDVWSDTFEGVWHLEENAPGTDETEIYLDSAGTRHGNDLVGSQRTQGMIGDCPVFGGENDRIAVLGPTPTTPVERLTISAWVRREGTPEPNTVIVQHGGGSGGIPGYRLLHERGNNGLRFQASNGVDARIDERADGVGLDDFGWHHVAVTFEFDEQNEITSFYVDGELRETRTTLGLTVQEITPTTSDLGIGAVPGNAGLPWQGNIDEVRISNIVRDGAWFEASFLSQSTNFVAIGPEQTAP